MPITVARHPSGNGRQQPPHDTCVPREVVVE